MTVVLAGLIGQFSATYLHRERGFLRFFLLLHLFAFGSLLAFAAGSFDLLVAGWEMVGITSVLLIAFFQQRTPPVENALRVFAVYRACDIGLLVSVFALHNWCGTASFVGGLPALTGSRAAALCLLLLLAAAGKAAQVPFSGWLPRAMEGPTPSSAIFYGAISIHAGAYLLLRVQPMLAQSRLASAMVIAIGLVTAIHGTMSGRASADAKTSLAYASLTQVGVVFVEIGLGWKSIAIAHILGHATVRTLQFLRAPSMLHDYHKMHSAVGGDLSPTGKHLEELFPKPVQLWLYRWALDRGHLDTVLDRFVIYPLMRLSRLFARLDGVGSDGSLSQRGAAVPGQGAAQGSGR
jgi:NAD(P)H-quinone oxidoreductase subunit 5